MNAFNAVHTRTRFQRRVKNTFSSNQNDSSNPTRWWVAATPRRVFFSVKASRRAAWTAPRAASAMATCAAAAAAAATPCSRRSARTSSTSTASPAPSRADASPARSATRGGASSVVPPRQRHGAAGRVRVGVGVGGAAVLSACGATGVRRRRAAGPRAEASRGAEARRRRGERGVGWWWWVGGGARDAL